MESSGSIVIIGICRLERVDNDLDQDQDNGNRNRNIAYLPCSPGRKVSLSKEVQLTNHSIN